MGRTLREQFPLLRGFWRGFANMGIDLSDEIAALDRLVEAGDVRRADLDALTRQVAEKVTAALLAIQEAMIDLPIDELPPPTVAPAKDGPVH
jgi:hypothetical protein